MSAMITPGLCSTSRLCSAFKTSGVLPTKTWRRPFATPTLHISGRVSGPTPEPRTGNRRTWRAKLVEARRAQQRTPVR